MAQPFTYKLAVNSASLILSGTFPALVLTAGSTAPITILRVEITQSSSTTSANSELELLRATAAWTGGTSGAVTPVPLNARDVASVASSAVSYSVVATGGGGTVTSLKRQGFNTLSGYLYLPVPEERYIIAPSGLFAVRLPTLGAATYDLEVVYAELS